MLPHPQHNSLYVRYSPLILSNISLSAVRPFLGWSARLCASHVRSRCNREHVRSPSCRTATAQLESQIWHVNPSRGGPGICTFGVETYHPDLCSHILDSCALRRHSAKYSEERSLNPSCFWRLLASGNHSAHRPKQSSHAPQSSCPTGRGVLSTSKIKEFKRQTAAT